MKKKLSEFIPGVLREVAKLFEKVLPKGWGFCIISFDFTEKDKNEEGQMFYVCNGDREDMKKLFHEIIYKLNHEE